MKPNTPTPSPWLTKIEAAARFKRSTRYVEKLARSGELPSYKRDRLVWFNANDVDAFIRAGRTEAAPPA
jgi:excisionase family DNA binding protein